MNLSLAKNWRDGSTLSAVPLCLLHFSCFSTSRAKRSVRSKLPPTKLFKHTGIVCSNNTLRNVENLLSIYNSTSCCCANCYIFYLFEQCLIQQIRSSSFLKSRVGNFALSFRRVNRCPIDVILGIFGRLFFHSWRSPIDFCIHVLFFFIVSGTVFCYFTFWLHDFGIALTTRVNSTFVISLVADFITSGIFTSLSLGSGIPGLENRVKHYNVIKPS